MSSLKDNPATYLRSQALRGRASLEQHHSSPIGAMHALDRLSKFLSHLTLGTNRLAMVSWRHWVISDNGMLNSNIRLPV